MTTCAIPISLVAVGTCWEKAGWRIITTTKNGRPHFKQSWASVYEVPLLASLKQFLSDPFILDEVFTTLVSLHCIPVMMKLMLIIGVERAQPKGWSDKWLLWRNCIPKPPPLFHVSPSSANYGILQRSWDIQSVRIKSKGTQVRYVFIMWYCLLNV